LSEGLSLHYQLKITFDFERKLDLKNKKEEKGKLIRKQYIWK